MRRFIATSLVLLSLVALHWGGLWLGDSEFRDRVDWFILEIRKATTSPAAKTFRRARRPHQREVRSWREIDAHAMSAPDSLSHDFATLACHLVAPARDDWDRVRAIFRWITEHIHYDDAAYNSKQHGPGDALRTLETRQGVCGDFAELFVALARAAGMDAVTITGWSKTKELPPGTRLERPDHAWNAVRIEGRWQLMDVTWAEGFGNDESGKLVTTKRFDDSWFAMQPSAFVMQHLPEDPSWQFLADPVSLDEFEQFPLMRHDLFRMGFDGNTILRWVRGHPGLAAPTLYENPFTIRAVNVPLGGEIRLPRGEEMELAFDCGDCIGGMSIGNNGIITDMEESCDRHSLCFVPKPGRLVVYGRKRRGDLRYIGIMAYEVKSTD